MGRVGSRRARLVVAAMAMALAVAACSNDDGSAKAQPRATVQTAPPTTADPYAIPDVIDAAYVNRVLAALDAAVGDIVRLVMQTRDIPPEVYERLRAIYVNSEEITLFLQGIERDLRLGFRDYKAEPGNKKSTVEAMLSATPACIYARVTRDYSAVAKDPVLDISPEWVGLKPRDPSRDPRHYNTTPWMITLEGLSSKGTEPPNPCTAS